MADKLINTNFDMGSISRVLNLPDAVLPQEPATFAQALALVNGMNFKKVRAATTANLSIAAPGAAIDGVTMVSGDRFLAKDQTTTTQNGIYIWNGAATPATRSADADAFVELEAALVSIEEGTANAGTRWRQTQVNGVVGTNNIVFVSDQTAAPAASETTAGILEIATQAEMDAGTDDLRAGTPLKIKTASWLPKKYTVTFGDGSATSFVITHNLNNQRPQLMISLTGGTFDVVECEVEYTSANTLTIKVNTAPAAGAYTVSLVG